MTTAQFIYNTYATRATSERRCSSVITDTEGTVYSYGYHYPLLIRVGEFDVLNTRGYSNTTAKHIHWARHAVSKDVIEAKLSRDEGNTVSNRHATTDQQLEALEGALARELKEIMDEMEKKPRKDTQVYRNLQAEHDRVYNSLKRVMEARA